ncbi:MAG: hypothetical protein PHX40_01860 [Bacilli bacterium]|nr:hypothetical protein [Bacilli bacterium]
MMLHSFYNSPGAKIEILNGEPIKLLVDKNMPTFDLNGLTSIDNKEQVGKIIDQ